MGDLTEDCPNSQEFDIVKLYCQILIDLLFSSRGFDYKDCPTIGAIDVSQIPALHH